MHLLATPIISDAFTVEARPFSSSYIHPTRIARALLWELKLVRFGATSPGFGCSTDATSSRRERVFLNSGYQVPAVLGWQSPISPEVASLLLLSFGCFLPVLPVFQEDLCQILLLGHQTLPLHRRPHRRPQHSDPAAPPRSISHLAPRYDLRAAQMAMADVPVPRVPVPRVPAALAAIGPAAALVGGPAATVAVLVVARPGARAALVDGPVAGVPVVTVGVADVERRTVVAMATARQQPQPEPRRLPSSRAGRWRYPRRLW